MAKRFHESSPRALEARDSGMLGDDRSAVANMPQDVKYHGWPHEKDYLDARLDDTIHGINKQISEDDTKAKKHLSVHKW